MVFKESLARKIGEKQLRALGNTRVGIAGAGGLGSNCAVCLVRSGLTQLKIVDYDLVEAANLDRQFYFPDQVGMDKVAALRENLLRINPELKLDVLARKIGQETARALFADCDIVAECLDRAEDKSLLVSELLPLGPLIVSASGLGGYGNSDQIKVHRIRKNLILIGDLRSDVTFSPALSPRVSITAAKQADAILEYILEKVADLRQQPGSTTGWREGSRFGGFSGCHE